MPTTTSARARVRAAVSAASALAVTGVSLLLVSPASAMGTPSPIPVGGAFDDGEERGTPMSPGTAVLVFVGIPLVVAAIIWLLVKAPGWTRSGRAGDAEAWTGDPLEVGGSADRPGLVESGQVGGSASAIAAPDSGEETGGTSARW
jgi:hypothetical protein